VYYHLKNALDSTANLTLEILDSTGAVIRRYSSRRPQGAAAQGTGTGPGGAPPSPALPAEAGLNRFVWDLRHERPTVVPGLYTFGAVVGRRAVPGTYRVKLTLGDRSQTEAFRVLPDPRVDATAADFRAQDSLAALVARDLSDIHAAVVRLRGVRDQLNELLRRPANEMPDTVQHAARALVERLDAMEDSLIQKRTVDGQTVINFPVRLNHHFIYLMNAVDAADAGVTGGQRRRYADLSAQWARLRSTLDSLLGADLMAFNALVKERGVPAVVVPRP
jgi:hypothetical protein